MSVSQNNRPRFGICKQKKPMSILSPTPPPSLCLPSLVITLEQCGTSHPYFDQLVYFDSFDLLPILLHAEKFRESLLVKEITRPELSQTFDLKKYPVM